VLIGVAISGDRNMIQKYIEIIKYKYLTVEMLNVNSKILPVIILQQVSSKIHPENTRIT